MKCAAPEEDSVSGLDPRPPYLATLGSTVQCDARIFGSVDHHSTDPRMPTHALQCNASVVYGEELPRAAPPYGTLPTTSTSNALQHKAPRTPRPAQTLTAESTLCYGPAQFQHVFAEHLLADMFRTGGEDLFSMLQDMGNSSVPSPQHHKPAVLRCNVMHMCRLRSDGSKSHALQRNASKCICGPRAPPSRDEQARDDSGRPCPLHHPELKKTAPSLQGKIRSAVPRIYFNGSGSTPKFGCDHPPPHARPHEQPSAEPTERAPQCHAPDTASFSVRLSPGKPGKCSEPLAPPLAQSQKLSPVPQRRARQSKSVLLANLHEPIPQAPDQLPDAEPAKKHPSLQGTACKLRVFFRPAIVVCHPFPPCECLSYRCIALHWIERSGATTLHTVDGGLC